MNELERLIAGVERPGPSANLDERIKALFIRVPPGPQNPRWKGTLMSCATAACVGILGFYLGRQSVAEVVDAQPAAANATAPEALRESGLASGNVSSNVLSVPLPAEQLAGLFVSRGSQEGLLGKGPVRIETFTSP
jgi:hypothetical protein